MTNANFVFCSTFFIVFSLKWQDSPFIFRIPNFKILTNVVTCCMGHRLWHMFLLLHTRLLSNPFLSQYYTKQESMYLAKPCVDTDGREILGLQWAAAVPRAEQGQRSSWEAGEAGTARFCRIWKARQEDLDFIPITMKSHGRILAGKINSWL